MNKFLFVLLFLVVSWILIYVYFYKRNVPDMNYNFSSFSQTNTWFKIYFKYPEFDNRSSKIEKDWEIIELVYLPKDTIEKYYYMPPKVSFDFNITEDGTLDLTRSTLNHYTYSIIKSNYWDTVFVKNNSWKLIKININNILDWWYDYFDWKIVLESILNSMQY